MAAFEAVRVDPNRLRPGERATVLCLACDKIQASIVYGYIKGYFERVPALASMVERITDDTIDLTNGAQITISTNSYRSVRGKTLCCAILDEVAYWRDDNSANPDTKVDAAITPGLARWQGFKKILISSPYRRAGLLYTKWSESFGKEDDSCLVVHGGTLQFNNTFPAGIIERELKRDREKVRAEYLAEWRDDLVSFIDPEIFAACVDRGVFERGPVSGNSYFAFLDPSSGSGQDSMVLTIAHKEGEIVIVDAIRECRPPFDPAVRCAEFKPLLNYYGIREITKDAWGVGFVDAQFGEFKCHTSALPKTGLYAELLPRVDSGQVRFLDNERMKSQACNLERRVGRSGRDTIDHPQHGNQHDDVIKGVAGAVWLAATERGPFIVTPEMLRRAKTPLPRANRRYQPCFDNRGRMINKFW